MRSLGVAHAPRAGVGGKRRQDAESAAAIERAKGMDARSERPASGVRVARSRIGRVDARDSATTSGLDITSPMASILEKIVVRKRKEVELARLEASTSDEAGTTTTTS